MTRPRIPGAALAAALLLPLAAAGPAHAYLDPGTGSYVVQMLIAGLVGAAFALKTFWWQVKSFVLGLFGRKPEAPAPRREGDADPSAGERPEAK